MFNKIYVYCFMFVSLLICNFENCYATDLVVFLSIPSDVWYENIYLIADKVTWMDYKNFTVQVGDMGTLVYNFPDWYHGKYDPALLNEDMNNDIAGPWKRRYTNNNNTCIKNNS